MINPLLMILYIDKKEFFQTKNYSKLTRYNIIISNKFLEKLFPDLIN